MSEKYRRQAEVLTAVLLTLWVAVLHVINLFQAGPLWRDEVGTVDFAAMPTVGDIWRNLRYDNFPPLFVGLARVWTLAGLNSDFGYRVLGFLIGLGTLGLLWWCARKLGGTTPLLALALYAANPVAIRVGDSLRPYGLAIALAVLTMTLVWNFVQAPGTAKLLWATLAATLSVQCFYPNAFFIVAFSCGAWAVTWSRKDWKTAWQTGIIGLMAALSLLPYSSIIKEGRDWGVIVEQKVDFAMIWDSLREAWQAAGVWMVPVWLALLAVGLTVAVVRGRSRQQNMIYFSVVLMASATLHLVFLRVLKMPPRSWYFLILMAPAALILDAIFASINLWRLQLARMALSLAVVLACIPLCYAQVRLRQSNIDLVAAKLKELVRPGDAVVVAPWYNGVALQRYFDASRWSTLPPLQDHRIHRYDLLKQAMMEENPIGPDVDKMRAALSSGHNLWLVGTFHEAPAGLPLPVFLPYKGNMVEAEGTYCTSWEYQIIYWLKKHGARPNWVTVPIPDGQALNPLEDVRLAVVQGWKQ